MIRPDYKEFARLSRGATLVPVVKSISADLLTPVSAFLAVSDGEPDAFLLESVEVEKKLGGTRFLACVRFCGCSRAAPRSRSNAAIKSTAAREMFST